MYIHLAVGFSHHFLFQSAALCSQGLFHDMFSYGDLQREEPHSIPELRAGRAAKAGRILGFRKQ